MILSGLILTSVLVSQGPVQPEPLGPGYDVIMVAGQSNTHYGKKDGSTIPDATLDATDPDIFQLTRPSNGVSIATEPLDHATEQSSRIGFALTFAKKYKQERLEADRDVLLVLEGYSGSGFSNNFWNSGDSMYNESFTRTNAALAKGSGTNRLVAILWHQGETDALAGSTTAAAHQGNVLGLIDDWRTEWGNTVPVVVGGMVPTWVAVNADRQTVEAGLQDIVNQRLYTGFATTTSPIELTYDTEADGVHFSADSQRGTSSRDFNDADTLGLAGRYYNAYLQALNNK